MNKNRETLMKFISAQNQKVQDDISKQGYKDNSPYRDNPFNIIQGTPQGTSITMDGVSKRLYATDGQTSKILEPNSGTHFFSGPEVKEIALAKYGGLLNKTIKCSNCGWSWKAADGGSDVMDCHKCGGKGLIKAQEGLQTTIKKNEEEGTEYFNQVKDWYNKYTNSPGYKENLIKSGYEDPQAIIDRRLSNINNTKFKHRENRLGSYYNNKSNKIHYSPIKDQMNFPGDGPDAILAHEVGHSSIDIGDGFFQGFKPNYNKYDYEQLKKRNKNPKISRGPHENYADQKAIQYEAEKQGLYKAGYDEFTKEILDKLDYSDLKERALRNYSEEDLIWLLNNIAQTDNNKYELPIAQEGGEEEDDPSKGLTEEEWQKKLQEIFAQQLEQQKQIEEEERIKDEIKKKKQQEERERYNKEHYNEKAIEERKNLFNQVVNKSEDPSNLFHEEWMTSPQYLKLLAESTKENNSFDLFNNIRNTNLKELKGKKTNTNEFDAEPGARAQFSPVTRSITYPFDRTEDILDFDDRIGSTLVHEKSHFIDNLFVDGQKKIRLNTPTLRKEFKKRENDEVSAIPQKDVDLINLLKNPKTDNIKYNYDYYTEPTEVRARLNQVRNNLFKSGNKEFLNRDLNEEDLKPLYENIDMDTHQYLKQLDDYFGKENTIQLLNSVSQNNRVNNELPVAQEGVETQEGTKAQKQSVEDARKYMEEYMNSPMYKDMLKNSLDTQEEYDNMRQLRNKNLNSAEVVFLKKNDPEFPNVLATSNSFDGRIEMFPRYKGPTKYDNTYMHELSHSVDRPYRENSDKLTFEEFMKKRPRLIPAKDINLMDTYRKSTTSYHNLYDKNLNNWKFDEDRNTNEYISDPTETRARLNELRYIGKKNNIYDPFTQKVTPEIFKKLGRKSFFEHLTDVDGIPALDDLREIYTDDQIINLLNTVSQNDKRDDQSPIAFAQWGGVGQNGNKKKKKSLQDLLRDVENSVNKSLGNPMQKAHIAAYQLAGKWYNPKTKQWEKNDPVDNFRHPMAGRYTSEAIQDKLYNIPILSQMVGLTGSNALGVAHELSTLFHPKDKRGWYDKIRESGEDIFNNAVGATVGSLPISDERKTNILTKLSNENMLPDGVSGTGGDMYIKHAMGGSIPQAQMGGAGMMYADRSYQVGGQKKPIYVESKNHPRYKAYNDSLTAYNRGKYNQHTELTHDDYKILKFKKIGYLPYDKVNVDLKNNPLSDITYEDNDKHFYSTKEKAYPGKVKPIGFNLNRPSLDFHGNVNKNNKEVIYSSVYKKPQQEVIVKPTTTKQNVPQKRELVETLKPLQPIGIQNDFNIEASAPVIRPEAQTPKSYNLSTVFNSMKGPTTGMRFDWEPFNRKEATLEEVMKIQEYANQYNAEIQKKYGPESELSRRSPRTAEKAADRANKIKLEVSVTPNYQEGGEKKPINVKSAIEAAERLKQLKQDFNVKIKYQEGGLTKYQIKGEVTEMKDWFLQNLPSPLLKQFPDLTKKDNSDVYDNYTSSLQSKLSSLIGTTFVPNLKGTQDEGMEELNCIGGACNASIKSGVNIPLITGNDFWDQAERKKIPFMVYANPKNKGDYAEALSYAKPGDFIGYSIYDGKTDYLPTHTNIFVNRFEKDGEEYIRTLDAYGEEGYHYKDYKVSELIEGGPYGKLFLGRPTRINGKNLNVNDLGLTKYFNDFSYAKEVPENVLNNLKPLSFTLNKDFVKKNNLTPEQVQQAANIIYTVSNKKRDIIKNTGMSEKTYDILARGLPGIVYNETRLGDTGIGRNIYEFAKTAATKLSKEGASEGPFQIRHKMMFKNPQTRKVLETLGITSDNYDSSNLGQQTVMAMVLFDNIEKTSLKDFDKPLKEKYYTISPEDAKKHGYDFKNMTDEQKEKIRQEHVKVKKNKESLSLFEKLIYLYNAPSIVKKREAQGDLQYAKVANNFLNMYLPKKQVGGPSYTVTGDQPIIIPSQGSYPLEYRDRGDKDVDGVPFSAARMVSRVDAQGKPLTRNQIAENQLMWNMQKQAYSPQQQLFNNWKNNPENTEQGFYNMSDWEKYLKSITPKGKDVPLEGLEIGKANKRGEVKGSCTTGDSMGGDSLRDNKYGGLTKYQNAGTITSEERKPYNGYPPVNNIWLGNKLTKEGYITSTTKGGNYTSFTGNDRADDWINKQIDSGKFGFDPKTMSTFVLKTPVKGRSKKDQFIGSRTFYDLLAPQGFTNESQDAQIKKLPEWQQDILDEENTRRRKRVVKDQWDEVYKSPLWYAPGVIATGGLGLLGLEAAGAAAAPYITSALAAQLPGMAAVPGATFGNAITAGFAGHGLANVGPDTVEMYKNPSWGNAGSLGMDVLEIAPIVGPAAKTIGEGISATGRALGTEKGLLSNTYKINPYAERLNDANKSYRVTGLDALEDFKNTGVVRSGDGSLHTFKFADLKGNFHQIKRPTGFPSFQKGYADMRYAPEEGAVVFETGLPTFKRGEINPVTGNRIRGRHYAHRVINPETGLTMTEIPAADVRVFGDKPHWWKGYQELEVPKNSSLDLEPALGRYEHSPAVNKNLVYQLDEEGNAIPFNKETGKSLQDEYIEELKAYYESDEFKRIMREYPDVDVELYKKKTLDNLVNKVTYSKEHMPDDAIGVYYPGRSSSAVAMPGHTPTFKQKVENANTLFPEMNNRPGNNRRSFITDMSATTHELDHQRTNASELLPEYLTMDYLKQNVRPEFIDEIANNPAHKFNTYYGKPTEFEVRLKQLKRDLKREGINDYFQTPVEEQHIDMLTQKYSRALQELEGDTAFKKFNAEYKQAKKNGATEQELENLKNKFFAIGQEINNKYTFKNISKDTEDLLKYFNPSFLAKEARSLPVILPIGLTVGTGAAVLPTEKQGGITGTKQQDPLSWFMS